MAVHDTPEGILGAVIDPFSHEFHVVHSFDAQLLVASHKPNRTNLFFRRPCLRVNQWLTF